MRQIILILAMLLTLVCTGTSKEKSFTLLHTSDEHSILLPVPLADYHPEKEDNALGGFARLSTLVKKVRNEKKDEPVLLFSSGDFIGGSPFAWLIPLGYSPELEVMKKIGYNAAALGNHEFDYGPDVLAEYFLRAGYPGYHDKLTLLGTNLNIPAETKLNEVEVAENNLFTLDNGLTIGVFSLLGEKAFSVAPTAHPVSISPPLEAAQKQVKLLRQSGADVIIALTHSGMDEDYQLASAVEGIDVILGGHYHYKTPGPEFVNNTIIFHSGYYLQHLGELELAFDTSTKGLRVLNDENNTPYHTLLDSSVDEDPEIKAMVDKYGNKLNKFIESYTGSLVSSFDDFVMYSEFPLIKENIKTETTTGNFITDAMRLMTGRLLDEQVDIAFQANGVIREDIFPGTTDWSKGKITFFDLVSVSGLGMGPDNSPGYPLVSFYLTGEDVYNLLETASLLPLVLGDTFFLQFSGLRYSYDPGKAFWLTIPLLDIPVPAYRSVTNAEIYYGEGIQTDDKFKKIKKCNEKLYHIVTDHYLASYLPVVGELLPRLNLTPRNKQGVPFDNIDQTIVKHNGQEFKVWETITRHALSFKKNEEGIPVVPPVYKQTQNRIIKTEGMPLFVWSYSLMAVLLAGLFLLIRWRIIKRNTKEKPAE